MDKQLQLDYYNTLLSTEAGRRVYFDLRKTCLTWFRTKDVALAPDEARAQCVLDEFVMLISEKCGINTPEAEMKMLEFEAAVAASMLEEQEKETAKTDLHEMH